MIRWRAWLCVEDPRSTSNIVSKHPQFLPNSERFLSRCFPVFLGPSHGRKKCFFTDLSVSVAIMRSCAISGRTENMPVRDWSPIWTLMTITSGEQWCQQYIDWFMRLRVGLLQLFWFARLIRLSVPAWLLKVLARNPSKLIIAETCNNFYEILTI